MRRDLAAIVLGAVVASAFPTPTRHGADAQADVAVGAPPVVQDVSVPEFVPVINFSDFLLAAQQLSSAGRPSGRDAAEALSAKFAFSPDPGAEPRHTVTPSDPIVAVAFAAPRAPDPKQEAEGPDAGSSGATALPVVAARAPDIEAAHQRGEGRRSASVDHERAARQFGPVMALGAEDVVTKVVTKRQTQRSRRRHMAFAEKADARQSAVPTGAHKTDYQVGIPGQSMEPLISSCTKPTRSCLLGLLCGC